MATSSASPMLLLLNDRQIQAVLEAALTILEQTGGLVQHPSALTLLKKAGARVDTDRVRLPRELVMECVESAPKGILIYDRNGNPVMDLKGRNSYFGTSTASPTVRDYQTGQIRETKRADIALGAFVADALENMDWVMPMGSVQDVHPLCADIHEFFSVVTHTIKPMVFIGYSPDGVRRVYEMATRVAGSMDQLREKPFVLAYPEPISPLVYPQEVVDRMFVSADLRMPQIPASSVQPGATAPVTLAGAVAQVVAEGLFSVVLIQLRKPGAPCFLAGNFGGFDMSTGLMAISPPEMSLGLCAQAEVARHLGLPSWGLAGSTDAKVLDPQAGMESMFAIITQAMAGLNLIHDVGYMDMGMVSSVEMLVMGDEAVAMARRFLHGMSLTPETLATDLINKVGPAGNYLMEDHTLAHFKDEMWMPTCFTRQSYQMWKADGEKSMEDRIREKIARILDTHQVAPLPEQTIADLKQLLEKGEKEVENI